MRNALLSALVLGGGVAAQNTLTSTADVANAAATAKTESPVSHVKGKAFDRIAIIWLENTDYTDALNDANLQYFAQQGILLTQSYAATHPSEPNYMAAVGGDYFGCNDDAFHAVAQNVSTIVDLLEDGGISWAEYQEGLPYSGFEGFSWVFPNGTNDYVRKHDPLIFYNSITSNPDRLAKIKNFTLFDSDLKENKLPQWMFITPNMQNDGHDTGVTYAGRWLRGWLGPLLANKNFMQNTLVLVTFDENESYPSKNKVWALLLGDAVPKHLVGTTDDHFYTHYSEIATVEANWGLHHLGRWDAGANVYKFVADLTGDPVDDWDGEPEFSNVYYNLSYAGPFNTNLKDNHEYPSPYLHMAEHKHHRSILPSIFETWKDSPNPHYYEDTIKVNDGLNPPEGYAP